MSSVAVETPPSSPIPTDSTSTRIDQTDKEIISAFGAALKAGSWTSENSTSKFQDPRETQQIELHLIHAMLKFKGDAVSAALKAGGWAPENGATKFLDAHEFDQLLKYIAAMARELLVTKYFASKEVSALAGNSSSKLSDLSAQTAHVRKLEFTPPKLKENASTTTQIASKTNLVTVGVSKPIGDSGGDVLTMGVPKHINGSSPISPSSVMYDHYYAHNARVADDAAETTARSEDAIFKHPVVMQDITSTSAAAVMGCKRALFSLQIQLIYT